MIVNNPQKEINNQPAGYYENKKKIFFGIILDLQKKILKLGLVNIASKFNDSLPII